MPMRGKSLRERSDRFDERATHQMARPCRCAASLSGREATDSMKELLTKWLGHADARQVYDLSATGLFRFAGLRPAFAVVDRSILGPLRVGKSETCRASAWQSHDERFTSKVAAHRHGRAMPNGSRISPCHFRT